MARNVGGAQHQQFNKEEYGRPPKGSKSESRGFRATITISKETLECCEFIDAYGVEAAAKTKVISFGELFGIYTDVSNKLVGMLLRARKHGLVDFAGEMLFQRRDDDVQIKLLKPIDEIRGILHAKIAEARQALKENNEFEY